MECSSSALGLLSQVAAAIRPTIVMLDMYKENVLFKEGCPCSVLFDQCSLKVSLLPAHRLLVKSVVCKITLTERLAQKHPLQL